MSRKNILFPYQLISAGDMSADVTSSITNLLYLDNICISLVFTGTPTGTFSVQGSNDYSLDINGNVINAGHWEPLTLAPAPVASGSGDSILINLDLLPFTYIKVVYTSASGSGTLNAWITGKAL